MYRLRLRGQPPLYLGKASLPPPCMTSTTSGLGSNRCSYICLGHKTFTLTIGFFEDLIHIPSFGRKLDTGAITLVDISIWKELGRTGLQVCSWFSQYLPSCAKRSLARLFCKEPTCKKFHQQNGKFSKCWDIKVSFNKCKKNPSAKLFTINSFSPIYCNIIENSGTGRFHNSVFRHLKLHNKLS